MILVRAAEVDFEGKVFDGDGRLSDEMAKFAADEAKLTQELKGFAKSLDKMFDQAPFMRPSFICKNWCKRFDYDIKVHTYP